MSISFSFGVCVSNSQPCGSVRRVPTRIAVILGKWSLYNCSASRIPVPLGLLASLGWVEWFVSLSIFEIESVRAAGVGAPSTQGSKCLHENKSRLYVLAESAMKSSSVVNGEGTGMYTAGIGFIGSDSGSLCAIAPAYRCISTVPTTDE